MENIEGLTAQIEQLKPYQKSMLEKIVSQLSVVNSIDTDAITATEMVCRKCGKDYFVKNGHSPGKRQRYKCKHCAGTQCVDANTPMYALKLKDKWSDFVVLMLDKDVRKTCDSIAEALDVERKTAHAWRHKFASSVAKMLPLEIAEEVEADEVYFPFCVKGVIGKEKYEVWHGKQHPDNVETDLREREQIQESESYQDIYLCLHNRNADFDFFPIKIQKKGNVSEADLTQIFQTIDLKQKTVITDRETSMAASVKKIDDVNHLTFKSSDMKKGNIEHPNVHNNHINGLMKILRDWLKQFNGVSAKYLPNYLKWFRFQRLYNFENVKAFVTYTLTDQSAYARHKATFENYNAYNSI